MTFQLILPKKIIYGRGKFNSLNEHLEGVGESVFVVCGKSSVKMGRLKALKDILSDKDIVGHYIVEGEPTCDDVDACREALLNKGATCVIGLGGGSALDVAKASAGLFGQEESTSLYLNKKPFDFKGIPFIGIPTTSGTGSEVTLNSVLYNPVTKNKASIAHVDFQAHLALVDPTLTYSMPPSVVAASGMDALTHAIESHTSTVSNIGTQLYTKRSIELIGEALKEAVGGNEEALDKLALGSLYAAMGFAQTGVGIAHAISHPLGAIFHMSHGIANAILLKEACYFNYESNKVIYDEISEALKCNDLYEYLQDLLMTLPIPHTLSEAGYETGRESELLEMTFQSRSLKKNPRVASEDDILTLIERCF